MKLVITGGRGGIGSAFTKKYSDRYDIVSLSRRTGHDIINYRCVLQQLSDADIFVNLATTMFHHQTVLLHYAYEFWKEYPNKIILNIGSCSALGLRFPDISPTGPWMYASSKASLYSQFDQCLQDSINHQACQVKMLTIGPTNAGPNLNKPRTLDPTIVADEMYRLLNHSYLYHSMLCP